MTLCLLTPHVCLSVEKKVSSAPKKVRDLPSASASPAASPRVRPLDAEVDDVDTYDGAPASEFSDTIDLLNEKRQTTREEALSSLLSRCQASFMRDELLEVADELLPLLVRSLKRHGDQESVLAADMLAVFFASVGPGSDGYFNEVSAALTSAARTGDGGAAEAVSSLALSCLIASDSIDVTLDVLSTLQDVFSEGPSGDDESDAVERALDGWGLVATSVSRSYIREVFSEVGSTLLTLLRADNLEVRIAAGELAALLVELATTRKWRRRQFGKGGEDDEDEDDDDEDDDDEDDDEDDDAEGVEEIDQELFEDLRTELDEIAAESDRRATRRDRARQRSMFRDIAAYFERGARTDSTQRRFGSETLTVSTWAGSTTLAALTRCLSGGFHVHVGANPTVRGMLGMDGDVAHKGAARTPKQRAADRRAKTAANAARSKERDRHQAAQRKMKAGAV